MCGKYLVNLNKLPQSSAARLWCGGIEFPKIQILTIEELLQGKKLELPKAMDKPYYKEAKPSEIEDDGIEQKGLGL